MNEALIRNLEGWAAIMTIVGFPFAIVAFLLERRKDRQLEEEEIYRSLSDSYREFLTLALDNPDLHLIRAPGTPGPTLTPEQRERQLVLFGILTAIFEQAYLLVYEETMSRQTARLWQSWNDYITEWCRRPEFRAALPALLEGEDPEFVAHVRRIAAAVESRSAA